MLGGRHSTIWTKIIIIEAVYLLLNTCLSFTFPFEQFPMNKVNFTLPFTFTLTTMFIDIIVFWIVTACNLADRYQRHFVNCLIWELVCIIVACLWQDHTIYVNVNVAYSHQWLSHGSSQLLPTVMEVLSLDIIHYMRWIVLISGAVTVCR